MPSATPPHASHPPERPASPALFETAHGAVLHCACCDRFQVMFDDVLLLLTKRDFEQLLHTVAAAAKKVQGHPPRWWRLATPTDAGEVRVPVQSDELLALHDLLKGAAVMHELDAMLTEAHVA